MSDDAEGGSSGGQGRDGSDVDTADDAGGEPGERDPTRVRAVAVHAADVVNALETNERGAADGRAVLRVTPPFSGRMRARIHLDQGDEDDTVHLPPGRLVADPPAYPEPDDTADALRADPDADYTPDRHRRRHERAVEEWRGAVRERIVDRVTLAADHAVDVAVIGDG